MISERSLARACRPAVLGRGRIIADHHDRIRDRSCVYDGSLTTLSARVTSSSGVGTYRVNVSLDEAGDTVATHACSCPAAARFPGPCKHAVAVMIDFNRSPEDYAGWNELEHVSTTSVVSDYLAHVATTTTPNTVATDDAEASSVRLEPTLVHDLNAFLRLRIMGGSGAYVVKSIGDLVARIADGSWYSYGKRLAFVHNLDAFEPWSRELAAFVGRCVQNRRAYASDHLYGHVYGVRSGSAPIGRELRLSGPETDEFIALCLGHELAYEYVSAEGAAIGHKVRVVDGNPQVSLGIVPVADGSFELVRGQGMDFLVTPTRSYAVQDATLYRCTPEFTAASDFFSGVYCSDAPNLLLSADDAARFAATALPTLEAALPVSVPPELDRLRPANCSIEFYLDCANGAVTCDVQAVYGDRRYHVLEHGRGAADFGRDLKAEAAARALVGRYFATVATGRATMPDRGGNDDALAILLFDGVPRMRRMGAVYVTDAFGRLTSTRRPRVTVSLTARANLIDLSVSADDVPPAELHALLTKYRRRQRYYRLRDGSFLDLSTLDLDHVSLVADELDLSADELARGHVSVPSYKAFLLDALFDANERDDAFNRYVDGFRSIDPARYEPPASLAHRLRPYQVEGFRWLSALVDMGFGGILADEMGLGKSVQLIALLCARRDADNAPAPSKHTIQLLNTTNKTTGISVVEKQYNRTKNLVNSNNRKNSNKSGKSDAIASTHAPISSNSTGTSTSPDAARTTLIVCPASLVYNWKAEFDKFAPEMDVAVVAGTADERSRVRAEAGHEVLVTSYDLVRRDVEAYADMNFWCVVLDEAQYIKNHETLVARAVKTLNATHRLALTGTPIENRLAELWSIFDFLMPGLLGGYERFRDRFEQALLDDDDAVERLRLAVGPFIMRRRKADVLDDLPDKLEQVVSTQMGSEQRRLYAAHEQGLRQSLMGKADAAFRGSKIQVLAELTRLRELCCDPRLVYEDYDGGSCKLDAIVELVESAISAQQKVLVFSQFTSYLSLIEAELASRGVAYYKIVGATPKQRRVKLVDAFNADDTPVFLVSLKAGGTGLNLVGASVVIHADPWWNAAAQNQATDRAHRIGQTRDVTVYKVIAARSIEERILLLQDAKSSLAEQVVDGATGATGLASLTRADLIALLGDD